MFLIKALVLILLQLIAFVSTEQSDLSFGLSLPDCEVAATTEQGYVCGRLRKDNDGNNYASFRGIPYAKQPVGVLRFKELQQAEPFDGIFNATEDGPSCVQPKFRKNPVQNVKHIAEDCIRINIHVPGKFMPDLTDDEDHVSNSTLLPVLVFIHGGAFSIGSGDGDICGPEYLMTKDIILVTFNYRINIQGFFSMHNEYFPGNNGLRDSITALKWIQRNIRNFGGIQTGSRYLGRAPVAPVLTCFQYHLLQKDCSDMVALSGHSLAGFYSTSKAYSKQRADLFLATAGIDPLKSPKEIHDELVAMPIDKMVDLVTKQMDTLGSTFSPVIETPYQGFTTVLPRDPAELVDEGFGAEFPMIIGFCSNEAAAFKKTFIEGDVAKKLYLAPEFSLPLSLLYSAFDWTVPTLTKLQCDEYFNGTDFNADYLVTSMTDSDYKYPCQRLAQKRLATGAADTYVYQFGYPGMRSCIKTVQNISYSGAGHVEDITYVFRLNHFLGPQTEDELAHTNDDNRMRDMMTTFISNFVKLGSPVKHKALWPPTQADLKFQDIEKPLVFNYRLPTPYMQDKIEYFTELYNIGLGK